MLTVGADFEPRVILWLLAVVFEHAGETFYEKYICQFVTNQDTKEVESM